MALNKNIKAFVLHISFLRLRSKMKIHLARKVQITLLLAKKVIVPAKYLDLADVFSEESANVLPKQTKANKHAIKLEQDKKLPYKPINSLGPIKL